jgi:ATP-dependent DNA helicase DinG
MARAVAETLENGGVLLAEAGTGTGKTLAYLVPAILSGRRVLVSTGTKNLQEQIYFKDLPVLQEALGMPFTATYMKGRANYLCLHRLQQARASAPPGSAGDELEHIAAWAETSETGDRAELEDLPESSPLWHDLSATADTCLGSDCPQFQECFVTRMRQRAAASDLVIVNHHLLCADAAVRQSSYGEVIPACHYAVVDEAHQLEDVATQYFGIAVSNYRLDELGRDAERMLNAGVVADEDGSLRRQVRRVDDHARVLRRTDAGRASRGQASERLRIGPDWFGDIVTDGVALASALDGLEGALGWRRRGEATAPRTCWAGAARHESRSSALPDGVRPAARLLRRDARARRVPAGSPHRRGRHPAGDAVRPHARHDPYLGHAHRGGLVRLCPRPAWPAKRRRGVHRVRIRLHDAGGAVPAAPHAVAQGARVRRGGRARSAGDPAPHRGPGLRAVHQLRRAAEVGVWWSSRTAHPLLVQGDAPRSVLLQRFRTTPHAVLLATSSFWQGVDVAGEQLSCVIIDKLPFASPGDPITAARVEAIAAEGGDPFHDYQVPLAVLTMLQGLGRLIRHRDDRGVLAILDPRLRTMPYGRRFLDSFPPAPVTHDLGQVERFFTM